MVLIRLMHQRYNYFPTLCSSKLTSNFTPCRSRHNESVVESFPIADGADGKEQLTFEWKRKSPNQFVIIRESEQNPDHFKGFFNLIKLYLDNQLRGIDYATEGKSTTFNFKCPPVMDVRKAESVCAIIKAIAEHVGSGIGGRKIESLEELDKIVSELITPYWRNGGGEEGRGEDNIFPRLDIYEPLLNNHGHIHPAFQSRH